MMNSKKSAEMLDINVFVRKGENALSDDWTRQSKKRHTNSTLLSLTLLPVHSRDRDEMLQYFITSSLSPPFSLGEREIDE